MSTLIAADITNPDGKPDVCARFEIPHEFEKFTLEGVTVANVTYTIGFWVKSQEEGLLELLGVLIHSTPYWKRYKLTFVAQNPDIEIAFALPGIYDVYHIKLETGNKDTDYTPAVEDLATVEDVEAVEETLFNVSQSVTAVDVKADGIIASVTQLKKSSEEALTSMGDSVRSLEKSVSAKMSAQDVQLQISTALENGTSRVVTTTGFTFDEGGMTVEKSGREMKTQITEDGMTVSRNRNAVLVANNQGVDAENLRATSYLIIGNSRFENYGSGRTGCFWIGGS